MIIEMVGAVSLAGCLIGIGVQDVCVENTQTITTQTPSVAIWSPSAQEGACRTIAGRCGSLTLPAVGPVGSTFDTNLSPVYITNTGKIAVTESAIQLTDSTNGATGRVLQNEMNICLTNDTLTVLANGPLARGLSLSPSVTMSGLTLAAGATDEYEASFYAGMNSRCGEVVSSSPQTAAAWSTPPFIFYMRYNATGNYITPASLNSRAEGGSVTVTVAFIYTNSRCTSPQISQSDRWFPILLWHEDQGQSRRKE